MYLVIVDTALAAGSCPVQDLVMSRMWLYQEMLFSVLLFFFLYHEVTSGTNIPMNVSIVCEELALGEVCLTLCLSGSHLDKGRTYQKCVQGHTDLHASYTTDSLNH